MYPMCLTLPAHPQGLQTKVSQTDNLMDICCDLDYNFILGELYLTSWEINCSETDGFIELLMHKISVIWFCYLCVLACNTSLTWI